MVVFLHGPERASAGGPVSPASSSHRDGPSEPLLSPQALPSPIHLCPCPASLFPASGDLQVSCPLPPEAGLPSWGPLLVARTPAPLKGSQCPQALDSSPPQGSAALLDGRTEPHTPAPTPAPLHGPLEVGGHDAPWLLLRDLLGQLAWHPLHIQSCAVPLCSPQGRVAWEERLQPGGWLALGAAGPSPRHLCCLQSPEG